MKTFTREEAEKFLPRLPATEFTRETDIIDNNVSAQSGSDMLELKGWELEGWVLTSEMGPGTWRYACMFKNATGQRYWRQVPTTIFVGLAEMIVSERSSRRP